MTKYRVKQVTFSSERNVFIPEHCVLGIWLPFYKSNLPLEDLLFKLSGLGYLLYKLYNRMWLFWTYSKVGPAMNYIHNIKQGQKSSKILETVIHDYDEYTSKKQISDI